jgi:hypothetical protein
MEDYGNDFNSQDPVVNGVVNAYFESKHAKMDRMIKNAVNFNVYHLKQDWSHKMKGQSREFLPKQAIAVEQLTSFVQQALVDPNKWFEVATNEGIQNPKILPMEIQKLLGRQLEKNNISQLIADTIKLGLLGANMILKVHGKQVASPTFKIAREKTPKIDDIIREPTLQMEKKPYWQLQVDLIRQEDWFPDPTNQGLYEIQRIEMDWYKLVEIAKQNPDIYDMDAVMQCYTGGAEEEDQKMKKYRETAQNVTFQQFRRRVTIKEYWGNILNPTTGEMMHENIVTAVAGNRFLIRPPQKNPFWHQESPFISAPIIRVPHAAWGKALMDGPTMLNMAQNELYNLMMDGGMAAVFGIRQLREQWLANPEQINDGIGPCSTLILNSQCPPGQKVLERVDTGALPPEALQLYNINDREFQSAAVTTDIRTGVLPQRQVKATEVIASQNAITGMFSGITKVIEKDFIVKFLVKCTNTMAQHMDDLHLPEVKALIGEQRGMMLSNMSPKEIFVNTVGNYVFKVFGLSSIMNKQQDFQKITSLLQTIGASPLMAQEFMKKYSMTKTLGEIVKALDIDEDKILMSPEEMKVVQAQQQAAAQAQGQPAANQSPGTPGAGGAPSGQPNVQSQIPQANAQSNSNLPFPPQARALL